MARRLSERFQPGDAVAFRFGSAPEVGWVPGVVVRHAAPGLWVMARDGKQWFVTNGSRIRSLEQDGADAQAAGDAETAGAP